MMSLEEPSSIAINIEVVEVIGRSNKFMGRDQSKAPWTKTGIFSKFKNLTKSNHIASGLHIFTPEAMMIFIQLRQTFFKALTLRYFKPDCYFCIETNSSGYIIKRVISE